MANTIPETLSRRSATDQRRRDQRPRTAGRRVPVRSDMRDDGASASSTAFHAQQAVLPLSSLPVVRDSSLADAFGHYLFPFRVYGVQSPMRCTMRLVPAALPLAAMVKDASGCKTLAAAAFFCGVFLELARGRCRARSCCRGAISYTIKQIAVRHRCGRQGAIPAACESSGPRSAPRSARSIRVLGPDYLTLRSGLISWANRVSRRGPPNTNSKTRLRAVSSESLLRLIPLFSCRLKHRFSPILRHENLPVRPAVRHIISSHRWLAALAYLCLGRRPVSAQAQRATIHRGPA